MTLLFSPRAKSLGCRVLFSGSNDCIPRCEKGICSPDQVRTLKCSGSWKGDGSDHGSHFQDSDYDRRNCCHRSVSTPGEEERWCRALYWVRVLDLLCNESSQAMNRLLRSDSNLKSLAGQVQKLRLVLRSRGLGVIRVGTVDDYQVGAFPSKECTAACVRSCSSCLSSPIRPGLYATCCRVFLRVFGRFFYFSVNLKNGNLFHIG